MKVSEKRMLLYLADKVILRIRPVFAGNGRFFKIMSFYGAGWTIWSESLNYKTRQEAVDAINQVVEMNPGNYIADEGLDALDIKPFIN